MTPITREWVEVGSPEQPTRRQLRRIAEASELESMRLELKRDPTGAPGFTVNLPAE